jgi:hypothetical protein
MANRHIKTINGRRYYYESIRMGKKVTSRYIGPVEERKRKSRKPEAAEEQIVQEAAQPTDENYIG